MEADVVFYQRNKMFVADFSEWLDSNNTENENENINQMTTLERESLLTSKEDKKALEAKEFLRKAGYPRPKEANHLVNDGEHIRNYFDTYGAIVESEEMFLISIASPLELTV